MQLKDQIKEKKEHNKTNHQDTNHNNSHKDLSNSHTHHTHHHPNIFSLESHNQVVPLDTKSIQIDHNSFSHFMQHFGHHFISHQIGIIPAMASLLLTIANEKYKDKQIKKACVEGLAKLNTNNLMLDIKFSPVKLPEVDLKKDLDIYLPQIEKKASEGFTAQEIANSFKLSKKEIKDFSKKNNIYIVNKNIFNEISFIQNYKDTKLSEKICDYLSSLDILYNNSINYCIQNPLLKSYFISGYEKRIPKYTEILAEKFNLPKKTAKKVFTLLYNEAKERVLKFLDLMIYLEGLSYESDIKFTNEGPLDARIKISSNDRSRKYYNKRKAMFETLKRNLNYYKKPDFIRLQSVLFKIVKGKYIIKDFMEALHTNKINLNLRDKVEILKDLISVTEDGYKNVLHQAADHYNLQLTKLILYYCDGRKIINYRKSNSGWPSYISEGETCIFSQIFQIDVSTRMANYSNRPREPQNTTVLELLLKNGSKVEDLLITGPIKSFLFSQEERSIVYGYPFAVSAIELIAIIYNSLEEKWFADGYSFLANAIRHNEYEVVNAIIKSGNQSFINEPCRNKIDFKFLVYQKIEDNPDLVLCEKRETMSMLAKAVRDDKKENNIEIIKTLSKYGKVYIEDILYCILHNKLNYLQIMLENTSEENIKKILNQCIIIRKANLDSGAFIYNFPLAFAVNLKRWNIVDYLAKKYYSDGTLAWSIINSVKIDKKTGRLRVSTYELERYLSKCEELNLEKILSLCNKNLRKNIISVC